MTPDPDPVMTRINDVVSLLHRGDREVARQMFDRLWDRRGRDADPLHVCALSHFMADAQDDAGLKLAWDLRALAAAADITEERARQHHPSMSIKAFYPSLHLNVADAYIQLGAPAMATLHVMKARAALEGVARTPLLARTETGIASLEEKLRDRIHAARHGPASTLPDDCQN